MKMKNTNKEFKKWTRKNSLKNLMDQIILHHIQMKHLLEYVYQKIYKI